MIFSFITLSWILISAICLWVLIEQRKKPLFMFFFIPLFLILSASTYFTVKSLLGFPTIDKPKSRVIYLAHMIDEPSWIYYWFMVEGEKEPRAFKFPYNPTDQENANRAQQLMEDGVGVEADMSTVDSVEEGLMGEGEVGTGGFTSGGALEWYMYDPVKHTPKDYREPND